MFRILIPTVLVLCATLAPAAETTPVTAPADAPASTCPLGNEPGSCQGPVKGQGKGKAKCQRAGSSCQKGKAGNG